MNTTTRRRPAPLASTNPRTATARRATGRVLRIAGTAPAKGATFNSSL